MAMSFTAETREYLKCKISSARESPLITISDQEKYHPPIKEINREICTELYNYTQVVFLSSILF